MPVKELLGFISQLSEEEISQLTEIAESMLSNTRSQPQPDETVARSQPQPDETVGAPPEKKRKNLFDEMPEKNHYKDPEDEKLYSSPITPRRPEVMMLELKCRSCGAKGSVPPQLSPTETERYLCNKCAKFGGT